MLTHASASHDPTRTITLRRQFAAAIRQRWQTVRDSLRAAIRRGVLGPSGYLDRDLLSSFLAWFREQMQALLLDTDGGQWMLPYLRSGFMRGVRFADVDAGRAGLAVLPVETFNIFLYRQELQALFGQAVTDIERIIGATLAEVEAVLGGVTGVGAAATNAELEALILDRIAKIGVTRSVTMAVTSVVGAVAEATLARLAAYGVRRVSAVVEWLTAADPCAICAALSRVDNGYGPGIYTIEAARGLIPAHPKCRCRWSGVFEALMANRRRYGARGVVYQNQLQFRVQPF